MMKRMLIPFALSLALVAVAEEPTPVSSEANLDVTTVQHGPRFVDVDGDGFNDNAPDADGDNIPNGLDEDYVRPRDGSGSQRGWAYRGQRGSKTGGSFVDANKDGICDNAGSMMQNRHRGMRASGKASMRGEGFGRRGGAGRGQGTGAGQGGGPGGN